MRAFIVTLLLFLSLALGKKSHANEITFDNVNFEWETNGVDESNQQRWTMLRFEVQEFQINGTCYLQCQITFTLESLINGSFPRYHLGVISEETVGARFSLPEGQGTFRKGFAGPSAQPPGFNRMIRSIPPADLLTIAWIVDNTEWLIETAVASGKISDDALETWRKLPQRFERELKSELGFLRPYLRSLE